MDAVPFTPRWLERLGSARPGAGTGIDPAERALATVAWSRERLFFAGDDYFAALLADIEAARHAVTIETYIFNDDGLGRRVEEALAAAAARGVRARLLVDGWGAGPWVVSRGAALAERGVEVRCYHPMPLLLSPPGGGSSGGSRRRRLLGYLKALNRRDHRKIALIDGRIAYVGSINVSGVHCCSVSADKTWRDTVARVEGAGAWELEKAFEHTWRRSQRVGRPRLRTPPAWRRRKRAAVTAGAVRLNDRLRLREFWYRDLLRRIRWSERRVWITNAYFVPNGHLVRALWHAAHAGRDVRVLVPAKSDVPFMPWVAAAFYHALLRGGVRVFEYQPCILHAKTMVIDDWVSVGSSNLNTRSLKHDLEVDVVLTHADTRAALEAQFDRDLELAKPITIDDLALRPWWQRLLARVALSLRYWM